MSIWGPLPVENDDAADWLSEFSEEPSISGLVDVFDEVASVDSEEYIEIPECSVAVAAATIVRDLFKSERSEYFFDNAWSTLQALFAKLTPTARINLIRKALKSINVVMLESERSELFQVIQDSPFHKIWLENMKKLGNDLEEIKKSLK